MIKLLTIDSSLADNIDKELHGKSPRWTYYPNTVTDDEYISLLSEDEKRITKEYNIEGYNIVDTQRFTDIIYSRYEFNGIHFYTIRNNQNSRYNKNLPNTSKLIDYIQFNSGVIPKNYRVKRIYLNLQTIRPNWRLNRPHSDDEDRDSISVLYYVNNSDGDTYFFKHGKLIEQISPIKGTFVAFPSNTVHAGSVPIKTETRIVINIVFDQI